ncbi:hypothetical protein PIB30_086116 [Stylosanthes scabra]|uniref:Putative plant transposon protein domain-containing protein n=1 Tax=Stylosanthes scabra TaxID=79078 RepID=A0ABU6USF5_9FABA|nr:hypothetical protein [Stylosanthes scabra]
MADRKADKKRKGKVVSSSSQVTPRFKTLYHEAHFNSKLSVRRILPELILQADENVFNPIRFQIHQRKWEKFTKPIQAVGHLMVKEFYANAWEPDKAKRKPLTYTSMVRGTEISFAPSNIKRVLKLKKDPLLDAPSYHERKTNKEFRLDQILYDMCEEGAEWVRHRDGRPHYLRKFDLEPMTKGWHEFVCRSILPTTNRSELMMRMHLREPTLYLSSPTYNVGNSSLPREIQYRLHVIRGSHTYNVETNSQIHHLSNSNSNPRSFGHQFHPLIKGIIGRIKRRLIED